MRCVSVSTHSGNPAVTTTLEKMIVEVSNFLIVYHDTFQGEGEERVRERETESESMWKKHIKRERRQRVRENESKT